MAAVNQSYLALNKGDSTIPNHYGNHDQGNASHATKSNDTDTIKNFMVSTNKHDQHIYGTLTDEYVDINEIQFIAKNKTANANHEKVVVKRSPRKKTTKKKEKDNECEYQISSINFDNC